MERAGWNMVVLRHDVPDGTWHFDWMLDLVGEGHEPGEDAGLVTFRIWVRPEGVPVGGAIRAEPLKAHRRGYLTFEGEIAGGRGRVARVLTGRVRLIGMGPGRVEFEAMFDGGEKGCWSVPRREPGTAAVEITRFA